MNKRAIIRYHEKTKSFEGRKKKWASIKSGEVEDRGGDAWHPFKSFPDGRDRATRHKIVATNSEHNAIYQGHIEGEAKRSVGGERRWEEVLK